MLTTKRISNGIFSCFWNDQPTKYEILNGDLGASGNQKNTYVILNTETNKHTVIGSIAKAKKALAYWLKVQNS